MAKVSPLQSNFGGGELSPLLYGRVDAERYRSSLATCKNYIPTIQGGLTRRPGTYFVAEVKDSSKATRLIRFEFSTTQAYILEFSDQFIRFYRDNAQITLSAQNISGVTNANPGVLTYAGSDTYANGDDVYVSGITGAIGTYLNGRTFKVGSVNAGANTFNLLYPDGTNVNTTSMGSYSSGGTISEVYTIASPYLEADLFELKFTQSADTLYIAHPSYAPRKLQRTAHTSWTLSEIDFLDGPYLPTNATTTTLTPSGTTGSVTITASAVTGINDDAGFASTDVGRHIRFKDNANTWKWLEITAWTSTTQVTALIRSAAISAAAASATWRLGSWSSTTGFPSTVTFHEDRTTWGGCPETPQRIDASNSSDYENMAPTASDGTAASSNALSFTFNAADVNVVRWLASEGKGLAAGTVGGEWGVRPSSQSEALSPTNITAKLETSFGSADISPVQVGKSILFVQRAGRKIRELRYLSDVEGFEAQDMTLLSEHITSSGLVELAQQKEPQSIVWAVRNDGALLGLTYERDSSDLRVGWHRHEIGGVVDAANNPAEVESVAVIPSSDGTREEVWMVVKRRINGATKRYVEYMTKFFEDSDAQQDGFFVDCGLTYDSPLTITGITAANPAVVTSNSHGLSNGNTVVLSEIEGMLESSEDDAPSMLNGNIYTVANVTANTFELEGVDSTSYTAYVSGGEARKRVTAISNLWHLEGQSVDICGDGAAQPAKTVTNGAITLSTAAAVVHVGFGFESDGQLLRLEAGAADGTALGKTRRTHRVGFLLHRSLGLKVGPSFDDLTTITFRSSSELMGHAPALFSGIISESVDFDYDFENTVCWRQDQPLPSTILAVMPQMFTQDRG